MNISAIRYVREDVGDVELGQLAVCGYCDCYADAEKMVDVSHVVPVFRGNACEDCAEELLDESHDFERNRADAWGRRVS